MKLKTGFGPGVLGQIVNGATEFHDVVQALYDAIPFRYYENGRWVYTRTETVTRRVEIGGYGRSVRSSREVDPSGAQRTKAVWDHFDHIDWRKAFVNVIANQIEDALFGTFGQLGAKSMKSPGPKIGTGPQTGPWDTFAGEVWSSQGPAYDKSGLDPYGSDPGDDREHRRRRREALKQRRDYIHDIANSVAQVLIP